MSVRKPLLVAALVFAVAPLHTSCEAEGCLTAAEGCVVPSPCNELSYTCDDDTVEIFVVTQEQQVPGGLEALGAIGDFVIRNNQVTIVIDALDTPNLAAQSGGFILDFSTTGDDNDRLNQIFHSTGALSEDFAVYKDFEIIREDGMAALQVEGHLFGNEQHRIFTRYELRACDKGLRVRSELINLGPDDVAWTLGDGWYWGNRQNAAFAPLPGAGYTHPSFGLSTLTDAFVEMTHFTASTHGPGASSLASVPCSEESFFALHSEQVSFSGPPLVVVTPGDFVVYERVHFVADGEGVNPANELALEARAQLRGVGLTVVRGRVRLDGGRASLGAENRASVHVYRGLTSDPAELQTPLTVAIPDEDGAFNFVVPRGDDYFVDVVAFGQVVETQAFASDGNRVALEDMTLPAAGAVSVNVDVDGTPGRAQLFVYPANEETAADVTRAFHGTDTECPVLLGYQFGPSPGCNRVLVEERTVFDIPPGDYVVFATVGTFGSLGREEITVLGDDQIDIQFALTRTLEGVLPDDALSADFHVHGGPSFDTSIPDVTRIQSALAQGLDVIAATEHDAIYDYEEALSTLNVTPDDLVLLVGMETTGFILFKWNPDVTFPETVGHWNFWPVRYRPEKPRNGGPFDEIAEPGLIFTRMKQADLPPHGVIQMNHPMDNATLGRDFGWIRALRLKMNEPLPADRTGDGNSAAGLFFRRPLGSEFRNSDFHTQEVMNGTKNNFFLAHRSAWFWLLNQGVLKGGTANSDSHSLTDNIIGTPRTVVFTGTERGPNFDVVDFNTDVREGRMTGTNGPLIDARVRRNTGELLAPSLLSFRPSGIDVLELRVSSAPWVPVEEIRIIVNGVVVRTINQGISNATNPTSTGETLRFATEIPLSELLPSDGRDSWIVVEAGAPLAPFGDLDCDGIPDTSDNNGDGEVDFRDVDRNDDGVVDASDVPEQNPAACEGGVGPFVNETVTPPVIDPGFSFFAVTPGGFPLAFTNPFIIDPGGDGFVGPGFDQLSTEEGAQ